MQFPVLDARLHCKRHACVVGYLEHFPLAPASEEAYVAIPLSVQIEDSLTYYVPGVALHPRRVTPDMQMVALELRGWARSQISFQRA